MADANDVIVIGYKAQNGGQFGIAMGNETDMDGVRTVSLGHQNRVTSAGDNAVQIGADSYMESLESVSVGYLDSISGERTVALGARVSVVADDGIAIGANSRVSGLNSIAIGSGTEVTATNEVFVGNTATTSIGGTVNWTATSDGRFKTNVQADVPGLDFINALEPVTYNFDVAKLNGFNGTEALDATQKEAGVYSGFIAQDVHEAAKSLGYDFSGVKVPENKDEEMYGLRYAEFVVPLVKAAQELDVKMALQEEQIQKQQEILAAQQELMQQYDKTLGDYADAVNALKAQLDALERQVTLQNTGFEAYTGDDK